MPKAKPTQVIVHRIELQEKEREMLETLVISKAASNVAFGINNMLAPVVAGFGAYTAYMAAKATHGFVDDEVTPFMKKLWDEIMVGPRNIWGNKKDD